MSIDCIDYILVKTPLLQTSRGIRVGDSIYEVFERYGEYTDRFDYSYETGRTRLYKYSYNYKYLEFLVDKDGTIVGIVYEIL